MLRRPEADPGSGSYEYTSANPDPGIYEHGPAEADSISHRATGAPDGAGATTDEYTVSYTDGQAHTSDGPRLLRRGAVPGPDPLHGAPGCAQ